MGCAFLELSNDSIIEKIQKSNQMIETCLQNRILIFKTGILFTIFDFYLHKGILAIQMGFLADNLPINIKFYHTGNVINVINVDSV